MKKITGIGLFMVMVLFLSACGSTKISETTTASEMTEAMEETTTVPAETTEAETEAEKAAGIPQEDLRIGFIYIGDENQLYTAAHYAGAMEMKEELRLRDDQIMIKWKVPEDETAYEAAVELADQGCQIIFGNSLGFEPYMMQAASEYPEVQFCHATGNRAAASGLTNMHNYFVSVYEARYVSGVVAGMKLNEMIADGKITEDNVKMGYVGPYPYPEVISGYTAFFLGARSVCPVVTMDVTYTNSWSSLALEKEAAEALIDYNCVLISQHGDTTGIAAACEKAGVPMVGYHSSLISEAPTQALTSVSINWEPYLTYAVQGMIDGTPIVTDWCRGYSEGTNGITELNSAIAAEGTKEKVKEVEEAIIAGTLKVFDTSTWTVDGKTVDSRKKNGVEYISDGYFHESEHGSAPAFDFIIDGITDLTK